MECALDDINRACKANKIIVVGIGPGSPDYIPPIAMRAITEAKTLVGSRRALGTFAKKNGVATKEIDRDIEAVLNFIAKKLETGEVVVMVSGDPGFYSLLFAIKNRFPDGLIKVIPGISSIQAAFAGVNEVWQDAVLISMHGRSDCSIPPFRPGKKLGILTDGEYNAGRISRLLLDSGWPETANVWICSDLSYGAEQVLKYSLKNTANLAKEFNHCVMVVKA